MVVQSAVFQASPRLVTGVDAHLELESVALVLPSFRQRLSKPEQSIDQMGKPDGIFGEKMKAAVTKFQRSRRLTVGGNV